MTSKKFRLGAILSITHQRLLARTGIGEVYEIAGSMVGRPVFTHELGLACQEAAEPILTRYPKLREINTTTINKHNWRSWLYAREKEFGDEFTLDPLPSSKLKEMSQLETLEALRRKA